jgi:membrane-associated protease RseP (regulator of RpoE activity)
MVYSRTHQQIFHLLALMFILLNMFNLIPVTPMDGGQIMEILFPRSGRWIQTVFILVSAVAIIYLVVAKESSILLVFLFFLIYRLVRIWRRTEDDPENETEPPGELSWSVKLMFLALWLATIIIPLQTLYRIN